MKNCYRIVLLSNENNNIFKIENFKTSWTDIYNKWYTKSFNFGLPSKICIPKQFFVSSNLHSVYRYIRTIIIFLLVHNLCKS